MAGATHLETMRPLVAALGLSIVFVAGSTACSGGSSGSSESMSPAQAVRDIATDPGSVLATIPAGSGIPQVQSWEIHQAFGAIAAVGIGKNTGAREVVVAGAFQTAGGQTSVEAANFVLAPDVTLSKTAVVQFLDADIEAAIENPGSISLPANGGLASASFEAPAFAIRLQGATLVNQDPGKTLDTDSGLCTSERLIYLLFALGGDSPEHQKLGQTVNDFCNSPAGQKDPTTSTARSNKPTSSLPTTDAWFIALATATITTDRGRRLPAGYPWVRGSVHR